MAVSKALKTSKCCFEVFTYLSLLCAHCMLVVWFFFAIVFFLCKYILSLDIYLLKILNFLYGKAAEGIRVSTLEHLLKRSQFDGKLANLAVSARAQAERLQDCHMACTWLPHGCHVSLALDLHCI